jgi:hypothetical protein
MNQEFTFHVFIDETGDFLSPLTSSSNASRAYESHVGGWVFKSRPAEASKVSELIASKLTNVLSQAVTKYNSPENDCKKSDVPWNLDPQRISRFELGKIFHFCEKGTENNPGREELLASFLDEFTPLSALSFFSSGRPRTWYSGPQDYYLRCLKRVITEVSKNISQAHPMASVHWTIASRWAFLPLDPYQQDEKSIYSQYHDQLASDVKELLKNQNHLFGLTCDVSIDTASRNSGLMAADFFIGLMRKQCRCGFCKAIKRWLPNENLKQRASDLKVEVIELEEPNLTENSWERFSIACQKKELSNDLFLLEEIIEKGTLPTGLQTMQKILLDLPTELLTSLLDHISEMIKTEYKIRKYRNESIELMCTKMLDLFPISYNNGKTMSCVLGIQKTALQIIAELRIHSGQQMGAAGDAYDTFMEKYSSKLFDSPVNAYMDSLQAKLVRWQSLFNKLEFESIEEAIKKDHDIYEKIIQIIPIKSEKDNTMAKLKGTLGQAYGFIGDLNQDPEILQMAKLLLEEDLDLCEPHSSEWNQVHNYLLTLAWVMEDMDLIQQYWNKRHGESWKPYLLNKEDFLHLESKGHDDSVYTYLNHLRILVLYSRINGFPTALKSSLEIHIKAGYEDKKYPLFMIAKWNLYLTQMAGITIFDEIKQKVENSILNETSHLIKFMKFPMALIINDAELNKKIELIIEKMENLNSEEQKIVLRFTQNINLFAKNDLPNLNWKIFRLMPFYYG